MTSTDVAAWWGGIASSLLLFWDVYKWKRQGPSIHVTAVPNMNEHGPGANRERTAILVTVSNTGNRATTITHNLGNWHPNRMHVLLRRKCHPFVVINNGAWGPPLPHALEPGAIWTGGIDQAQIHRNGWDESGILRVGVKHSSATRPVMTRVRIKPNPDVNT